MVCSSDRSVRRAFSVQIIMSQKCMAPCNGEKQHQKQTQSKRGKSINAFLKFIYKKTSLF